MLIQPVQHSQLQERNKLLHSELRPDHKEYSIVEEYPLVLGSAYLQHSYIAQYNKEEEIVAHVNFFPTTLVDSLNGDQFPVGLIGNVATKASYQGKGVMRALLAYFREKAKKQNLFGLFLWSDLLEFYGKQGFEPFGAEKHYYISRCEGEFDSTWNAQSLNVLDKPIYRILMGLRLISRLSVERTYEEFRAQLAIPDSVLLMVKKGTEILAYGVVGKGQDMIGVVHEWGACELAHIKLLLQHVLQVTQWRELILLAPKRLDPKLDQGLKAVSTKVEEKAMVLACDVDESLKARSDQIFFYGFDSI